MKTKLLILVVMALWLSSPCAPKYSATVAGASGASEEAELLIYELIIRNMVTDTPEDKIFLVSFGESWIDHVDPPEGFFERLTDTDVALKPVSQRSRPSSPVEVLIVLHLLEWTSDTEASVAVTRFRFGVGVSYGFTARVEWADGVWKLKKTTDHWGT